MLVPSVALMTHTPKLPEAVGRGLPDRELRVVSRRRLGIRRQRHCAEGALQGRTRIDVVLTHVHGWLAGRDGIDRCAVARRRYPRPPLPADLCVDHRLQFRYERRRGWV